MQATLSANELVRLHSLSNHFQAGHFDILLGTLSIVAFPIPFDFVGACYLTPNDFGISRNDLATLNPRVYATELASNQFTAVAASPSVDQRSITAKVAYTAFGLLNIASLPSWRPLLYGGLTLQYQRQYRAAFVEYAIAFENYVGELLAKGLQAKYDESVVEFFKKNKNGIIDRCTIVFDIAFGQNLSSQPHNTYYLEWKSNVNGPRNKLLHGEQERIDRDEAEKAYQSTLQFIYYIESLLSIP